jgi:hypothetical protein
MDVAHARVLIDGGLVDMSRRTLVPASEVIDLLLDLRATMATAEGHADELDAATSLALTEATTS